MSLATGDNPSDMDVWLVTDVYPPECGGSGWSAHSLALTLASRGHAIEVITLDPQAVGISQRVFDGIRVVELGVRNARRNPVRRLGARDYVHESLESYLCRRLPQETSVRVVHAQHLHSGPPAVAAARRHGRASVQTLRDYWPVCLHGTSWLNAAECPGCSSTNLRSCMREYWGWPAALGAAMVPWARRRLAARRTGIVAADRVIAVSDWVRKRIEIEAPDANYTVLPNIVDAGLTAAAADAGDDIVLPFEDPYLVAAGKLIRTKGFDIMLEDLSRARCRFSIVIAGAGPERVALERRAAALDLRVAFTGWLPHRSLLRLIRSAWAFLLPGAWNEPLSRLLLESMALGTPVLAWNSGGNPEHLTSGVDSWVINEVDDLRTALRDLEDGARRDAVGAAGRGVAAEKFSSEAIYPRLIEVYRAALDAAGESGSPT